MRLAQRLVCLHRPQTLQFRGLGGFLELDRLLRQFVLRGIAGSRGVGLRLFLGGQIVDDDDAVIRLPRRGALQGHRHGGPQISLVLAAQPLLQPVAVDLARQGAPEFVDVAREVVGMGEMAEGQLAQLGWTVSEQAASALIDPQDRAVERGVHDADRRLLEGLAEQLFTLHRVLEHAVRLGRNFLRGQKLLGDLRELRQHHELDFAEIARLRIHGAQRADGLAVAGIQGNTQIRAYPGLAGYQRVIREARIGRRVANRQGLTLQDGLGTERAGAGALAQRQADARLEPEPILVDQRYQHHGYLERRSRQPGHPVEGLGGKRLQKTEPMQGYQAFRLVDGDPFIVQCSICRLERSSHAPEIRGLASLG